MGEWRSVQKATPFSKEEKGKKAWQTPSFTKLEVRRTLGGDDNPEDLSSGNGPALTG